MPVNEPEDLTCDFDAFAKVVRTRRSVRAYHPEPVPDAEGRAAPVTTWYDQVHSRKPHAPYDTVDTGSIRIEHALSIE